MNFKTFVKDKVSASQFEALHEVLNVSKKKLTQMLNEPERMDIEYIRHFATLTGENAAYLVDTFNCGKQVITIDELDELRTEVTVPASKFPSPSKIIRA